MLCGRSFGQGFPKFRIPVASSIAERIPTHPIESMRPDFTRSSLSLGAEARGNSSWETHLRTNSYASPRSLYVQCMTSPNSSSAGSRASQQVQPGIVRLREQGVEHQPALLIASGPRKADPSKSVRHQKQLGLDQLVQESLGERQPV